MHMTKTLAKVFGWVFILVGVLGFFSNPIVGEDGLLPTQTLVHNIVHLRARHHPSHGFRNGSVGQAARWLKIVGVVYLLVAILGFLMTPAMGTTYLLGIVEVNTADNWLHVVLGIVVFLCGFAGGKKYGCPDADRHADVVRLSFPRKCRVAPTASAAFSLVASRIGLS